MSAPNMVAKDGKLRTARAARLAAVVALLLSLGFGVAYHLVLREIVARTFDVGYLLALLYVAVPCMLVSLTVLVAPGAILYNQTIGFLARYSGAVERFFARRSVLVATAVALAVLIALLLAASSSVLPAVSASLLFGAQALLYLDSVLLGLSIGCALGGVSDID